MTSDTKVTIGVVGVIVLIILGIWLYMSKETPVQQEQVKGVTTTTGVSDTNTASSTATTTTGTTPQKTMTHAIITTNKGVIEIDLATDKPLAVGNFQKLVTSNFYDGVRFHRVIKGFMIQAGDPLSKDLTKKASWGTGGPGYTFNDELTGTETYPQGTLAMANAGPNTNGSQFFIVTAASGAPLPPSYTVFGKVTKGLDVALAIENVQTDASDKPLQDVIIQNVEMK